MTPCVCRLDRQSDTGWSAALHDPAVAAALSAIHGSPGHRLDRRRARRARRGFADRLRLPIHRPDRPATHRLPHLVAHDPRGSATARHRYPADRHRPGLRLCIRERMRPAARSIPEDEPTSSITGSDPGRSAEFVTRSRLRRRVERAAAVTEYSAAPDRAFEFGPAALLNGLTERLNDRSTGESARSRCRPVTSTPAFEPKWALSGPISHER